MKRLLVQIAKGAFNVAYRIARKQRRDNRVVFLSRQTNEPSYDYVQLAREFEARGWDVRMHLKKVSGRNMPSYAAHVLREIRLLGTCKVAVLDRYDPVVSLIDFECEQLSPDALADAQGIVNREYPKAPVVLQLWHAFGAFKKFGHQSVNTIEGHSGDFTSTFHIHRNYSWVVCSGAGARKAFAEAFSCLPERVIAMDRPEYDELLEKARTQAAPVPYAGDGGSGAKRPLRVLMAPTLRIDERSPHPIRELYARREALERELASLCPSEAGVSLEWSFHPLESGLPAPGNVSDALLNCDCVVTDYSSIAYEAYVLGKPVVFYVPDIADYRLSPGLNADPLDAAPSICALSQDDLARKLAALASHPESYAQDGLDAFAASAFEIDIAREGSAAARLADFLVEQVVVS